MKKLLLFIAILLAFPYPAMSDTHTASSCNNTGAATDVQDAIDVASDGDTVIIPAGTCSWDTKITLSGKGLLIQGAGHTSTIISEDIGGTVLEITTDAANSDLRITGISLNNVNGTAGAIVLTGDDPDWRIDNCSFSNMTGRGIYINGYTYGVIDNCSFSGTNGVNCILIQESDTGAASWTNSWSWGSSEAIFVEDCSFEFTTMETGNSPIDSRAGAKWVARYNVFEEMVLSDHGICGSLGSSYRGTIAREIYGNEFSVTNAVYTAIGQLIGGTALIYNNDMVGPFNAAIKVTEKRTCDGYGVECTEWDRCDGDSVNDGNEDSTGWPCLDQIGRGPNQTSMPMYEWDNVIDYDNNGSFETNGDIVVVDLGCIDPDYSDHIQPERDFYNDTEYSYTPYTYPHPLRRELRTHGGGKMGRP